MEETNYEMVTITVPRMMVEHIIKEKEGVWQKVSRDMKQTIAMLEEAGEKEVDTELLLKMALAEKLVIMTFQSALEDAIEKKNDCAHRN